MEKFLAFANSYLRLLGTLDIRRYTMRKKLEYARHMECMAGLVLLVVAI